jgi:predicted dehydrogenase
MVETADRFGVHLSCHQNRRFDEDYLMIGKIVRANRIGELFYLETFVGGSAIHAPTGIPTLPSLVARPMTGAPTISIGSSD